LRKRGKTIHEQVSDLSAAKSEPQRRDAEQQQLAAWNETDQAYPQVACVQELVAALATATPDRVALGAGAEVVNYRDLNGRANRLAHYLRSQGAGPGTLVAICLERSLGLVVAELGVLKSGAAYLPLDPSYPRERLSFILNDSRAPLLIAQAGSADRLPKGRWRVLEFDRDADTLASFPETSPELDWKASDSAYVIYTSGSTGRPKGVEITHDSLLNLVFWHRRAFAVESADRAALQASPGFDASVWELWPYLTAGASVHLPDESVRSDAERLRDWLIAQKITITFLATAMAERLMALDWPSQTPLRMLLTGADTLHRYPSPSLPFVLVNNYGPTECTVVATSGVVPPRPSTEGDPPTIGRPIANTQIYLLDEQMRQVPIGATGEVYIAGKGLARGYLNQTELTAEKFVAHPFSTVPGARLYKTGDLARHQQDGQIAFVGRADDQIKLRGYRIEPSEIVDVLDRYPAIQASQVVRRADEAGENRLVAYLVLAPAAQLTNAELRDYLRAHLPDYMVPGVFVVVDSLPLTSNGKVDRDRLPPPSTLNLLPSEPAVPAKTLVEQRVTEILASLLHLEQVGANDNFFLLGGHSLLGTQVIARVRDTFSIDLSLRSLFEAPTVAELSSQIERLLLEKLEAMSEEEAHRMLNSKAGPVFGEIVTA
jgi:amino acid adenylation domain-containing protein